MAKRKPQPGDERFSDTPVLAAKDEVVDILVRIDRDGPAAATGRLAP